ncbi:ricin B lectin domain-containing protein [Mycena metata]|uniref:Ricin B lectin domain-containing protein n=1 Tax=Mycena metata TaxID=1033252 RepID=A0AAD7IHK7_9AGAR|nr:ricin B lectin domain-containing protein [Mycena metata]
MVSTSLALSVFILSAAAQLPGQGEIQSLSPAFFDAGFQGCISAPQTNINGPALVIYDCNNEDFAFKEWHLSFFDKESAGPQPITTVENECTIFDNDSHMCIDVTGGVNVDGTKLQICTCTGGPNQQWISVNDFTLQWSGTDKCIDLTNGIADDGNILQIWTCTEGNLNQKWIGTPNPDLTQVANIIGGDSSAEHDYCITAASDTDGAEVILAACLDSPFGAGNITWTVPIAPLTSQLQTFSDKCLDVPNGSNANGVKLQI